MICFCTAPTLKQKRDLDAAVFSYQVLLMYLSCQNKEEYVLKLLNIVALQVLFVLCFFMEVEVYLIRSFRWYVARDRTRGLLSQCVLAVDLILQGTFENLWFRQRTRTTVSDLSASYMHIHTLVHT